MTLESNSSTRQVAELARDGLAVVCPDCGDRVGSTIGGGKVLPGRDAVTFGWECEDCNLTLPANCGGPDAPEYVDSMRGIEVEFRDGEVRYVPVPKRYAEKVDP